jgi:hypothetical protein
MTNYCFTLAYNLVTEVEKVTRLLNVQNDCDCFKHIIVDLGFPLIKGNEIPDDFEKVKKLNSKALLGIADVYGSQYVKMENIGVSQNWTQVYNYIKPTDDDILIGCDPDEHPLQNGWVKIMGDVMREGGFGMLSLMMTAHINSMKNIAYHEKFFSDRRVYICPNGSLNWALIGISGKFFNKFKEVPVPAQYPKYGGIEGAMYPLFRSYDFDWGVLADYQVQHTDFELGDSGTSKLLREWKNQIIFNIHQYGQLSFEEYLTMKREDKI